MNKPARRIHPTAHRSPQAAKRTAREQRVDRRRRRQNAGVPANAEQTAQVTADFETEVLPHQRELFATALRYTKSAAAAEDLVQETMMRALTAWGSFQPGSNCRAWLYRILTNSFINIHRKRKRYRHFAHERGDDGIIAFYGAEMRRDRRPDERVIDAALSDEVTAAMADLTPEYRKVVELADLEGIRYKDIASRLSIPIGTVMSRLFRARRQLEAGLAHYAADSYGIRRAA